MKCLICKREINRPIRTIRINKDIYKLGLCNLCYQKNKKEADARFITFIAINEKTKEVGATSCAETSIRTGGRKNG